MKIAIDVSRAINEKAGIGRITMELVRSLLDIDKKNEYLLIFSYYRKNVEKERIISSFAQKNVKIKKFTIPGELKERLWGIKLPILNRIVSGCDVFLAPSFLEYNAGIKIPQIVIIYDMTTFLFPNQRGDQVSNKLNKRTIMACRGACKIIAISESTKKDLTRIIKINKDKIRVIYPGLKKFKKIANKLPNGLIKKQYVLFTGTIEPRKNLLNLIKAYQNIPQKLQEQYPLAIAGMNGWNNELENEKINSSTNIKYLGHVSDAILARLYKDAKLFIYPSFYEGFGLPVIEAMQFGTPVITSNVSSMPEAGGKAALYCAPDNPKLISKKLQNILEFKKEDAKNIRLRKMQANRYSYKKMAKETLDIIRKVNNE